MASTSLLGTGTGAAATSGGSVNTSLAFRRVYGVNSSVADNLAWADESSIVYVAGHSLVLYNRKEKKQSFINFPVSEISESITALTSARGKRLAAVAERGGEHPQVHIFDLKMGRRKKTLSPEHETSSKEIVSMSFSEDNQLLLTLTGAPDYVVMCWDWAKAKLLAFIANVTANPFHSCSFSPIDSSVACVTGKDCVRFFRISAKDMRILHDNTLENHNYTAHCWLRAPEDTLVAGTDTGELVLFCSGEYKAHLPCLAHGNFPVTAITSFALGFIVGSFNCTFLFVHLDPEKEKLDLEEQFTLVRTVSYDAGYHQDIMTLSLSIEEDGLVALTSNSQILQLSVNNPVTLNPESISLMQISFHGPKSIQGMDICLKKPLIITCSKDNTLRIWNFLTNEIEVLKTFPEDMFCAALHPSGLHCAVGFSDKLRIYHVLVDDLRICLELPIKACREARFSGGGHMIAAANGNTISVYELRTGDKVIDLKGHNGKVRSLHWLESGHQLLSCGMDGAVYKWDLDGRRLGEFVQKGVMYTSTICSSDRVFAVGSDKKLLELESADLAIIQDRNAESLLGQLALSITKGALFASSGDHGKPNSVRAYAYPINGEFIEYLCVSNQISRMRLTPDEMFLVVADESGCIVVMELRDRNDRFTRNPAKLDDMTESVNWQDEILLTKADLEEKLATIIELKTKVEEIRVHIDYQQNLKDMNYAENVKEVEEKYKQELEQSKSIYGLLQEEITDCETEYSDKKKQMQQQHLHDLQEAEADFQAQVMEQVDKCHSIIRERDAHIERLDEQRLILVETHEKYIESLTSDYDRKLEEEIHTRTQFEEEKAELHKELEEACQQLEDDVDTEVEGMKSGYDLKLSVAKESTLKYKGENGMLKKRFTVMQQELELQKEEEAALREREKELHVQITVLEKEISAFKKEIKARDGTIGEKEKRIYELKKKNQELDKFKFVLDFKIRELKRQIEPRQQEISAMKDQIRSMDEELEKYHRSNASLDAIIGTLRGRLDETQQDIKMKRDNAKAVEQTIKGFKSDLQLCMSDILEPVKLRQAVENLVSRHGSSGEIKANMDPDVSDEYERHRDFLVKSVQQLKGSLEEEVMSNSKSLNELMKTNMTLIDQINKQREENKMLKGTVSAATGRLTQLARVAAEKMAMAAKEAEKQEILGLPKPGPTGTKPGSKTVKRGSGGVRDSLESDMFGSLFASKEPESTDMEGPLFILERNRRRIQTMRLFISELQDRIIGGPVVPLSMTSATILPPLDDSISRPPPATEFNGFSDSLDLMSPTY